MIYNSTYKLNEILSFDQKEFINENLKLSFSNLNFKINNNQISFNNKNKKELKTIKNLIKKLIYISKNKHKKTLFVQKRKILFTKDPLKYLKKNREVVNITEDVFQFQGNFLNIFRKCNEFFYQLAIKKFKAVDQENPVLWPIELYKKINYFSEFPQQSLLIFGLKKNYKNLKKFSKKYDKDKSFTKIKMENIFNDSEYGLQPAVCDNCYYALRNMKKFKNTVYTTYNKVFRDEKSNTKSLDRLISFSVRDIMFVGDQKFVIKIRDKLLKELENFFKKTNLDCSIEVADDPFFIGKIDKKIFQNSFELKYEILTYIPFLKKKIAVGSINYHMDTFSKAFNIAGKSKIFSGCIGIGFERLLLAMYSQHGTDLKKWPINFFKMIKY